MLLSLFANITLTSLLSIAGVPAVDNAIQVAEKLGYAPCHPEVVDAISGWSALGFGEMPSNVAAWAVWPEAYHGACQIGLTSYAFENGQGTLDYLAQHEVCHLAVGAQIDSNQDYKGLVDRQHEAPEFINCMNYSPINANTNEGQQLSEGKETTTPGSVPQCPDSLDNNCGDPNAVIHDSITGATSTVRDLYPTNPPTDEEHCALLNAVKPWIPCS